MTDKNLTEHEAISLLHSKLAEATSILAEAQQIASVYDLDFQLHLPGSEGSYRYDDLHWSASFGWNNSGC